MKTETILARVSNGTRCKVDFKTQTVKLGKKQINFEGSASNDFITKLRELYKMYKYSTPNKRTLSERRNYFRAVGFDELSTLQLAHGVDREFAKAKLELFVLANYVNGNINTLFTENHWFWQDDEEKSLVILRDWFN